MLWCSINRDSCYMFYFLPICSPWHILIFMSYIKIMFNTNRSLISIILIISTQTLNKPIIFFTKIVKGKFNESSTPFLYLFVKYFDSLNRSRLVQLRLDAPYWMPPTVNTYIEFIYMHFNKNTLTKMCYNYVQIYHNYRNIKNL